MRSILVSTPSLPLDDRDGAIWFNGKLVPWRDAKVHVLAHSLHYGNAVFEGARIYNGKVFKLAQHSARLIHSAKMLAYDLPYSVDELTWSFTDMSSAGGKMTIMWDKVVASVPFKVGN